MIDTPFVFEIVVAVLVVLLLKWVGSKMPLEKGSTVNVDAIKAAVAAAVTNAAEKTAASNAVSSTLKISQGHQIRFWTGWLMFIIPVLFVGGFLFGQPNLHRNVVRPTLEWAGHTYGRIYSNGELGDEEANAVLDAFKASVKWTGTKVTRAADVPDGWSVFLVATPDTSSEGDIMEDREFSITAKVKTVGLYVGKQEPDKTWRLSRQILLKK